MFRGFVRICEADNKTSLNRRRSLQSPWYFYSIHDILAKVSV